MLKNEDAERTLNLKLALHIEWYNEKYVGISVNM